MHSHWRRACGMPVALAWALLAPPLAAAQKPLSVPRVGFLSPGSPSDPGRQRSIEAFRHGLRDLGWIEGHNIVLEFRWAEGQLDRLPGLASELVRLKIDLIVAGATPGARAAKQATTTIPIVMVGVGDPVGLGYVASLGRPGGNITGVSSLSVDLGPKRLELVRETVPGVSRVSVMWNPADPARALEFRETQAAAGTLGLRLLPAEVRSPRDIDRAFASMARERADALIVQQDPFTIAHRTRIADLALKNRLPTISTFREFPEAGGLMAYGTNLDDLYRRAAAYVDKILKGAKPGDLPVEQPMRFELLINMKVAKALGLTIPQSIHIRADQVIQ